MSRYQTLIITKEEQQFASKELLGMNILRKFGSTFAVGVFAFVQQVALLPRKQKLKLNLRLNRIVC